MATCALFTNFGEWYTKNRIDNDDPVPNPLDGDSHQTSSVHLEPFSNSTMNNTSSTNSMSSSSPMQTLIKFEDNFSYHLSLLMEGLQFFSATETTCFSTLVTRLDYNQYYARLPRGVPNE